MDGAFRARERAPGVYQQCRRACSIILASRSTSRLGLHNAATMTARLRARLNGDKANRIEHNRCTSRVFPGTAPMSFAKHSIALLCAVGVLLAAPFSVSGQSLTPPQQLARDIHKE